MSADNQAVRHWERLFAERPAGLGSVREAAFARFREAGFPRPKAHGWRHTNIAPLARIAFEVDKAHAGEVPDLPVIEGARRLVFVNGRFHEGLSDAVEGFSALRDADEDRVRALLLDEPSPNGSFVALNTALMEGGAVIEVPAGADVGTVHLVFATTQTDAPAATNLRNLVVVGANARLTVVEHHVGPDGDAYFTNAVTDVVCRPGSFVRHARIQQEGGDAWHVSDLRVRLERDARVQTLGLSLGAKLARAAIHAILDGPGAEADLFGLYLGRGRQHLDHPTTIEHRAPHGTSRETYKGILDQRARGVFSGMVLVREAAQKTSAEQSNRNLLLSEHAHADSEPQLEIHADDVKCSHGSAIGRLDDDALFYLRARGIGLAQARVMLTRAFATDVLEAIDHPQLRAAFESRITAWLDAAAFGGAA